MRLGSTFGIDLGTSTIKIYSLKKDKIYTEKNMVAIRDNEQVLAVGNEAYEMFEKAPANVEISTPVAYGTIANLNHAEIVLHTMLAQIERYTGYGPVIYFSVPMNMSQIERRAYEALAHAGQLKRPKVLLVERPICDAIALGIPIQKSKGSMIVNMGAQAAEISIIANEQVIISKQLEIGGKQLNEAICDAVRRRNNLLIGKRTAKRLKLAIADLTYTSKEARKIIGMNTLSGLPREGIISSALITDAIKDPLHNLAIELKSFIERVPPQIAANIEQEGVYLAGGTTRIPGMDHFLSEATGFPMRLSSYYEYSTIKGLQELITHKTLHKWTFSVRKK